MFCRVLRTLCPSIRETQSSPSESLLRPSRDYRADDVVSVGCHVGVTLVFMHEYNTWKELAVFLEAPR